uniref:Uncharacterized protein n=1 Tax=Acrobeloides nanus TaxID=290746 RepID=A0A914CCN7_9BILA
MNEDLTCNETMPAGDDPDALRRFAPQQSSSQTNVQSVFTPSSLQRLGLQNNTHTSSVNANVSSSNNSSRLQPTDLSRFRRTPSTSIRPESPSPSFSARIAPYSSSTPTTTNSNTSYLIRNSTLSATPSSTANVLFSNLMQDSARFAQQLTSQFQSPNNRYSNTTTNNISNISSSGHSPATSFRSVVQSTPRANNLMRNSVTPTPQTQQQTTNTQQGQSSVINHNYASILNQHQTSHIVNSLGSQVLGASATNTLLRQSFTKPEPQPSIPQTTSQAPQQLLLNQQKSTTLSNPIRSSSTIPPSGRPSDISFLANHILGRTNLGLNDTSFQNPAQNILSTYQAIMPSQTRLEALYRPQVKETIQSGTNSGHATPPAATVAGVNASPSKPSILRRKNDTNGSPVKRLVDREITRPASVSGMASSSPNFMENTGRQTASVLPDSAAISDDSQQYGGTSMMFSSESIEELRSDDSPRKRMRKQQFEAPSVNDKLKMEVNLKPPEIPIWRTGTDQIIGPDGQTIINQTITTPRPFDSPDKGPKKRGRPRKVHTPLPSDQQGYPIGAAPISTTANPAFPDSGTRSVMVDMGPILNPMGAKKRKYTKRPKEINPETGEVIKKPRKEGSGRKKKVPQDEATTQQINEVVNAVHLQLAKYKVEQEQRERQLAQQQQQQILQQQVKHSTERDRGAQTLVMMQNRYMARVQDSEKIVEVSGVQQLEQAGPSYVQTDSKSGISVEKLSYTNLEAIQKIHFLHEQKSSSNTPDIIHISTSRTTPLSRPYPTLSEETQAAIEEIIKEEMMEEIKMEPLEMDEATKMRKRHDTDDLDAEVQFINEGKEKEFAKAKRAKVIPKSKKLREDVSDFESDSESAMPSFLMDELQNLLLPFPRPISPLVPSCSKQYMLENNSIDDKVGLLKPKVKLNNLNLDYNPRSGHFKTFSDFRQTCEKIRSIPTACTQWATAKKRINKLKEKIRLLRAWKTLKTAQENFTQQHLTIDISKISLDAKNVEPLEEYEPPNSLDQFYEEIERLERRTGRLSIIPPVSSAGDSDLLDVYDTVSDIVDTVSSMDETLLKSATIIEFEEKDILGMPTTPLYIALGEESTSSPKIQRHFYNVVMPKLRLRRRKNHRRKKTISKIDDDIDLGDEMLNTSISDEHEEKSEVEKEEAKKMTGKVELSISQSAESLLKVEEMYKQALSLQERINLRKSEHLTDELRKRLMEVSKQLKQMRFWTKNFVNRMQNGVYASWMDTLDNIQGSCPSDTDQLKYDQMTAFFLEVPSFKSCFKSKKIYDTTGGVTINPSNQMVNFMLQAKSPYFKSSDLADLAKLDGINGVKTMIHEVKSHAITQMKRLEQEYMNIDDLESLCSPYTCAKAIAELIRRFPDDEFIEMSTYDYFSVKDENNGDENEPVTNLVEEFLISGQNLMKNRDIPSKELLASLSEEKKESLLKDAIHHTREMSACILQSMHERSSIMKQCHDALEEAFINLINSSPPPDAIDEFEFLSDSENNRSSDDSGPDEYPGSNSSKPIFKRNGPVRCQGYGITSTSKSLSIQKIFPAGVLATPPSAFEALITL